MDEFLIFCFKISSRLLGEIKFFKILAFSNKFIASALDNSGFLFK